MNKEHNTRRLKLDLPSLEAVMEDASMEHSCYLDLESGQVLMVTDETRRQLEQIYEENDDDDIDIGPILAGFEMPDWEKEALREADQVERDLGTRYISIPRADSDEGYRDMDDFISTVQNQRLHDQLTQAISGPRPFRRFKDVLVNYSTERERWFSFSNSRIRARVLEWLEDEGIEPV